MESPYIDYIKFYITDGNDEDTFFIYSFDNKVEEPDRFIYVASCGLISTMKTLERRYSGWYKEVIFNSSTKEIMEKRRKDMLD